MKLFQNVIPLNPVRKHVKYLEGLPNDRALEKFVGVIVHGDLGGAMSKVEC